MSKQLSPAEERILRLQADGHKIPSICHALQKGKDYVEYRLYSARRKLGLKTMRDVVLWGLKLLVLLTVLHREGLLLQIAQAAPPTFPTSLSVVNPSIDASLAWDRAPDTNVIGYKVWYGNVSRTNSVNGGYPFSVMVGNVTNVTLPGLAVTNWYFAATSYDAQTNNSEFSNEAAMLIGQMKTNRIITIRALQSTNVNGPWVTAVGFTNVITKTNPTGAPVWYKFDVQRDYQ